MHILYLPCPPCGTNLRRHDIISINYTIYQSIYSSMGAMMINPGPLEIIPQLAHRDRKIQLDQGHIMLPLTDCPRSSECI